MFGRVSISHQNPVQGVKGILNLRTAFYLGIKRRSRGRWEFLNIVPKIELGPQIWGAKIILLPIFPQFWTQGAESFWALRGLGDTFVVNFKTLTLKTGRGEK